MSAHSSPFMLDDLHFAPPSPVLVNSCFNDFDLFDCPVYPSSRPASPCRVPSPSSDTAHVSSSFSTHAVGSHTATIARRSVHLGGKQLSPQPRKTPVNWARPIRLGRNEDDRGRFIATVEELESGVSLRLFGASMQRQRRLGRQSALSQSSSPSPTSATPSSSHGDREPLTPSTQSEASPVLMTPPSRMQRVTQTGLKGLGVGDLFGDWSPRRQVTIVEDVLKAESETPEYCSGRPTSLCSTTSSFSSSSLVRGPVRHNAHTASHSTLLSTSSPTNLEELQMLRRAASALEEETKRPIRVGGALRKIKRKPVPPLLEDLSTDGSVPRLSPRLASLPFSIPERQSSMAPRAAGRPASLELFSESPRSSSDSDGSPMPSACSSSSTHSQDDYPVTPGAQVDAAQMFQIPSAFAAQSYLLQVDAPPGDGLSKGMPANQLADALQRLQDASPTRPGRRALSKLTSHFSRSVL